MALKNHLENINNPEDLRKLKPAELDDLALEIRNFIIEVVSVKRGHLGASLGVVELTITLHYVFNTPDDILVWDVGHQAYPHKILTGRKGLFHSNRQYGGLSGFPKREESPFDPFGTGHSSTSISAVLGMAMASKLQGKTDRMHIAVIGDASIASGMAFEGLNHAGVSDANLLVVLNDNEMGIDPNVGALKNYLTSVKDGQDVHQKNVFEALDFDYFGPLDGHDTHALIEAFEQMKTVSGPKILHVITKKGKGLPPAEKDQVTYHAPGPFDKHSGALIKEEEKEPLAPKFQDVFGWTLVDLAAENEKIVGITPAMPTGSSLKYMIEAFPDRAFDVGIAEQHAVTLAAGLATQGMIPYCTIYSTFLQRAYDQVIHDVAIQNLPVVFCIDRSGLVGEDGATHHGVFDLAFLRCIPNLRIVSPMDAHGLRNALYTAQKGIDGPLVIRYPRGRCQTVDWKNEPVELEIGRGACLRAGTGLAVLSHGAIGTKIKTILENDAGLETVAHYDFPWIKPLDQALLKEIFQKHDRILTLEEGVKKGGFGSAILEFKAEFGFKSEVEVLGLEDDFIEHGSMEDLYAASGLDEATLGDKIRRLL